MMPPSVLMACQLERGGIPVEHSTPRLGTYRFCLPPVVHFGDPAAEYAAAHDQVAVFDVTDRAQIEIAGSDAKDFLHSFCTNDVKQLSVGKGCEAFITTVQGKTVAHVWVFQMDRSLWIETTRAVHDAVLTHLDRYIINQDVKMHSHADGRKAILLAGMQAAGLLEAAGLLTHSLERAEHVATEWSGHAVHLRRIDALPADALPADAKPLPWYSLVTSTEGVCDLWEQLVASGAVPGGAQVYHTCRIEAGLPLSGLDVTQDNLAQEAARSRLAISFTKGCYLGQEPIARIDAMGHVNRELRVLRGEGLLIPDIGDRVENEQGQEIGVVTSSAIHAAANRPLALAYVRRGYLEPGTNVWIGCGGGRLPAQVDWPETLRV